MPCKFVSNTRKLSKMEYNRPEITLTDTLQDDDTIRQKLANYEETKVDEIALSTHVRYITYRDGKPKFCLGGLLVKIAPEYVILANETLSWSVQKVYKKDSEEYETRFFAYITKERALKIQVDSLQKELEKKNKEIEELRSKLKIEPNYF